MPEPGPRQATRRGHRTLVFLVVVTIAVWLQRGHVTEIPSALDAIAGSDAAWIAVAVVGSVATYLMAAVAMIGTVQRGLPFRRVFQVQVASGLTTLAAPAGLGGAGLNVWFLERVGIARHEAFTAALRNGVVGGVVHVVGLIVVAVKLPGLIAVDAEQVRGLAVHALPTLGVLVPVLAVVVWWQRARAGGVLRLLGDGWGSTSALLRRPDRGLPLLGGSIGLSLSYGVTFWASAQAIGVPLDLPTAIAIELVVEAVGNLSATPGGVGVIEAAGLQALLIVGIRPAPALAVVLLHRLLTFWLPAIPGALALRGLQRVPAPGPGWPPDRSRSRGEHGLLTA